MQTVEINDPKGVDYETDERILGIGGRDKSVCVRGGQEVAEESRTKRWVEHGGQSIIKLALSRPGSVNGGRCLVKKIEGGRRMLLKNGLRERNRPTDA